jgi:hypothetical protein
MATSSINSLTKLFDGSKADLSVSYHRPHIDRFLFAGNILILHKWLEGPLKQTMGLQRKLSCY